MYQKLILAATLLFAVGCSDSNPKRAPVSGTVTMDGKPLPYAWVNFQPMASGDNINPGRTAAGATDAQGRYQLNVDPQNPGAVVAKHRVSISRQYAEDLVEDPSEGGVPADMPRLGKVKDIPARYNAKSELTFEVPSGGTDKANFDLHSK
jgi:hypothetical protein